VRVALAYNSRLQPTEIAPLRLERTVGLGVGAMLGG
jgi:hypothetical protein